MQLKINLKKIKQKVNEQNGKVGLFMVFKHSNSFVNIISNSGISLASFSCGMIASNSKKNIPSTFNSLVDQIFNMLYTCGVKELKIKLKGYGSIKHKTLSSTTPIAQSSTHQDARIRIVSISDVTRDGCGSIKPKRQRKP